MTDIPAPPPGSTEAATRAADQAATELGLGTDWAALGAPDWARVCRRAGAILAGQGQAPAPGPARRGSRRPGGRPGPSPARRGRPSRSRGRVRSRPDRRPGSPPRSSPAAGRGCRSWRCGLLPGCRCSGGRC